MGSQGDWAPFRLDWQERSVFDTTEEVNREGRGTRWQLSGPGGQGTALTAICQPANLAIRTQAGIVLVF